jgi:hypothetical protein
MIRRPFSNGFLNYNNFQREARLDSAAKFPRFKPSPPSPFGWGDSQNSGFWDQRLVLLQLILSFALFSNFPIISFETARTASSKRKKKTKRQKKLRGSSGA